MSSDQHCLCNFCNSQVKNIEERLGFFNVECPICGKYIVPHNLMNSNIFYNKISSYLVHNSSKSIPALFMKKADMDILNDLFPNSKYKLVTNDDVEAFYPTTFSERINRILLWFANRSSYYGEYIDLNETILKSICFINLFSDDGKTVLSPDKTEQSLRFVLSYLHNKKLYLENSAPNHRYRLSYIGYEKVEQLQTINNNQKKVFVSMAFNDNTKETREAIRTGITKAKYDATLIDEIIHNKQIVPEMFRLIRESQLLVMDISEPNYGAYYEAGYAQGLGKEVIITCSEKVFTKKYETQEEKQYEKYLKPHFDIAQKQILIWKNEEDLANKLAEWIKAIE